MKCIDDVIDCGLPCLADECRYHIDYPADLNCTHIAIMKHSSMKLQQIGDRLHLTAARIKQVEEEALKRLSKRSALLKIVSD